MREPIHQRPGGHPLFRVSYDPNAYEFHFPRGQYLIPISLGRVINRLIARAAGTQGKTREAYKDAAQLCANIWKLDTGW